MGDIYLGINLAITFILGMGLIGYALSKNIEKLKHSFMIRLLLIVIGLGISYSSLKGIIAVDDYKEIKIELQQEKKKAKEISNAT